MKTDFTKDLAYREMLRKDIAALDKTRKLYSIQSEWLKLMLVKQIELETLNKVLGE